MEKLVDGFRQHMLKWVEEGCDCCQLKYKHLILQLFLRLLSYNNVDYHVDCFHGQRLIVSICPQYLATTVQNLLLLIVGNPILNVVLDIIPKFSVFFVDGIRLATDITHGPNYHRDILQCEGTSIETAFNYRLQFGIQQVLIMFAVN
jgi:hypothetical protein